MLVKQLANDQNIINFMAVLPSRNEMKNTPGLTTLQNTKASNGPDIDLIYFVSEKGNGIVKHNEQGFLADWDLLKRQWYIDTKAKGDVFFTAPYQDASSGKVVISVTDPVVRDGKTLGATGVDITLDEIVNSISKYKVGQAGKGFAVVADEIKKIVLSIQTEVKDAVNKFSETRTVINEQNKSVGDVNEAFNNISRNIEGMILEIDEYSKSIKELNKCKDAIVNDITNISTVSEETAAATEEVVATIQEQSNSFSKVYENILKLDELVSELNNEMNKFQK